MINVCKVVKTVSRQFVDNLEKCKRVMKRVLQYLKNVLYYYFKLGNPQGRPNTYSLRLSINVMPRLEILGTRFNTSQDFLFFYKYEFTLQHHTGITKIANFFFTNNPNNQRISKCHYRPKILTTGGRKQIRI